MPFRFRKSGRHSPSAKRCGAPAIAKDYLGLHSHRILLEVHEKSRKVSMTMRRLSGAGAILLFCVACAFSAWGNQNVSLAWDPSLDTNVLGYFLYYSDSAGNFFDPLDVKNHTTITVPGLKEGMTYTFVVTAYDREGVESEPSNQVSYIVPGSLQISPGVNTGDPMCVAFPVLRGRGYALQASADLRTWTRVWSTVGTANEWVKFFVPDATTYRMRFFRVISF
jgi:hypothetical protein